MTFNPLIISRYTCDSIRVTKAAILHRGSPLHIREVLIPAVKVPIPAVKDGIRRVKPGIRVNSVQVFQAGVSGVGRSV